MLSESHGRRARWRLGVAVLLVLGGRPTAGHAHTCETLLGLDYMNADDPVALGDQVRVRITLGAGPIKGGSKLSVDALRFFLQCKGNAARLLPCAQDGAVVAYLGDDTITSTCPDARWTTGHPRSARPNQVVFRASTPVHIPADTPVFCNLEFDVRIIGVSGDATPDLADQVVALGLGGGEASCDDGLRAAAATSGGIGLCPTCSATSRR